ncbi:MAG: zeta toxin family protein [Myxococcales bacterium]
MTSPFDARPIVVAIAGPNGAGKSTFFAAHLARAGLRFVNADDLARELGIDALDAARLANELRKSLVEQGESFVFETVFSDPVGEKVEFLRRAVEKGYAVVLCFVGISSVEVSQERVAMRVLQGAHDVPDEKLAARFPRTQANLARAIRSIPHVLIYDNDDLARPFRRVGEFRDGKPVQLSEPLPDWLHWE